MGLSEWVDLLLIAVGLGLLATELFVIPGFGVVGFAGILCLVAGIYLSFTFNDFTFPEFSWQFDRLRMPGEQSPWRSCVSAYRSGNVETSPLHAFGRPARAALCETHGQGYVVQTASQQEAAVGLQGVAASMLRPVGRGRFGDRTFQVVSPRGVHQEGHANRYRRGGWKPLRR